MLDSLRYNLSLFFLDLSIWVLPNERAKNVIRRGLAITTEMELEELAEYDDEEDRSNL